MGSRAARYGFRAPRVTVSRAARDSFARRALQFRAPRVTVSRAARYSFCATALKMLASEGPIVGTLMTIAVTMMPAMMAYSTAVMARRSAMIAGRESLRRADRYFARQLLTTMCDTCIPTGFKDS